MCYCGTIRNMWDCDRSSMQQLSGPSELGTSDSENFAALRRINKCNWRLEPNRSGIAKVTHVGMTRNSGGGGVADTRLSR